ncbi:transporter substrate-binding domain-containing protein [Pseudomarimonas salicorniae]|uniref:Transporter substrate-binding domain-containing protein n=1 Tax=Pseudomarimonas salicorniae TaxID=2933270 RepID=A0ABT0GLD0_9GAMM|nr:transporter substrate-binding domain-containing protein [Lysobacter sp. CAU 1642]MCK7595343.1 transporter substrate-binding domain-containing protein [Lysobacter sp. CAU 1642]
MSVHLIAPRRVLLYLLLALLPLAAMGQDAAHPPDADTPLEVGVRVAPPFVIDQGEGRYGGIAVALWEGIARANGWQYRYRPVGLDELFVSLEAGEIDVGLGALTVTAEREQRVDFSHSFHADGLAIAVNQTQGGGVWEILRRFFSWQFFAVIASLCATLAAIGVLAWWFERRANPEQFGGRAINGIGNGFWWAAVTMATVGYGDKAPVTLAGRILGLIWMFAAILLVASFTASITAALTVGALDGRVQGADDLPQVRVATIASSTSAEWLEQRGVDAVEAASLDPLLRDLADNRVDAVVYDAPILAYHLGAQQDAALRLLPGRFDKQHYAIALAPHSPLREVLNRSLLEEIDRETWRRRMARELGTDES